MNDFLGLIAVPVYLLSGLVKGTLGIGLPTTAVSLMAQFGDARTAIALAVIPMLMSNGWQVYRSGGVAATWQRYWPLIVSMMLLIAVFSQLATAVPGPALGMILGGVIVLFAAVNLWRRPPPLPARFDLAAQLVTGTLAGMMGGIAGIWAPPIIVYLSACRLERDEFVRVVGLILLLGCLVLTAGYWRAGIITTEIAGPSLLLVLPAVAGFALGERLRRHLSGERFRQLVLLFFLLMGLNLIRRALVGE